ncbi:ABC transporter ATP-binding protein/permease [Actinomycetospora endophytica]|uniref:ABC transporter ATP-binding protein/permease n=1 Tax=Actinomycetospora endophytica TaxID=2291215 RepID=A0ABS8PH58_9PSEU|nr:ABC transporter ATP-binding protein [Actinomycetospora endophytica]MCD2197598.1 ABC transporter ATP-binding protein/permease [Actinomycetospora endophytica]
MTDLLPTASPTQTRAEARAVLRPQRGLVVATLATLVVGTVLGLVGPRVLGHMIDLVLHGGTTTALAVSAGVLLLASLGQALFTGAGSALMARLGQTAVASVRERVVDRALRVPSPELERTGSGDLVARVSGDVESVNDAVSGVFPTLVEAALLVALTLVALLVLDWRFAVAGLLAVPLQAVALRWFLRTVVPVTHAERIAEGARAQQILDSVDGADTVRAHCASDEHVARIAARSDDARVLSIRLAAVQRRFFGKLNYGEVVGLCAILAVGYVLVGNGSATVGAASAAALYFHRLFDPFNQLLGLFDDAQTAGAAFARLVGVAAMPERPAPAEGPRPEAGSVGIAAREVSFRYSDDGPDVLRDVDLVVEPGKRVAVVGTTGAGKTTLVGLVAGLHRTDRGAIRLGGVAVDDLGPRTLRRTAAVVSQETHVFAGTLADDLRLAAPDADDDELLAALERVGAGEWVASLPEGLETRVGKGGRPVDAARAEQLALARLVLGDPPVALLDEATAEAGSTGARVLEASADAALHGRTALVVAHRLTQAATADRVVVLDAGRVVEHGTHADLLAAGGRYAHLWQAWSAAHDRPAPPSPTSPEDR